MIEQFDEKLHLGQSYHSGQTVWLRHDQIKKYAVLRKQSSCQSLEFNEADVSFASFLNWTISQ